MKQHKLLQLIIVFILIANDASAQWQWAKQIGGALYDGGDIMIDANSNIYCAGRFFSACYFDNDTLNPIGNSDIFLAKYDANGIEQWARRMGSNNPASYDEYPGRFVIDINNNYIYMGGRVYGTFTIDGQTATGPGIFLSKFDFSGNCLWIKNAGSPTVDNDRASAIAIASDGSVYWTGILEYNGFVDTIPVDAGTFLAKFNSNGNLLWARNEVSKGDIIGLKIKNNELFMSGTTRDDTTVVDTISLISTPAGAINAFYAKLDTSGNVFWAKRFGGPFEVYGFLLELDASNSIYLVGRFNDSLIIENDTLTNGGKYDMFFGKFDNSGNLIWINQSHANGVVGALAAGVIKDIDANFYIVGKFSGSASFGAFNLNSSAVEDMFVARYDDAGNCLGIRHFGEAEGYGVQSDNAGNVFVSGIFVNTISIGVTSLTSHGDYDMFFAKSDAITGIGGREINLNNQLIIYANPNAGKCNITVPDDFLHEKKLTLSIYDNTGRLIQQKNLEMNEGKIKLNLEAEAKGVYNVTLNNGKKSYNGKIVFE